MRPRNILPLRSVLAAFAGLASLLSAPLAAQELPQPGPEHALLRKMEGTWTAAIKSMGSESSGTQTSKMECGGLWLSTDFQADFGGMKFHGRGFDGYDPAAKKYVSVWVDSMSTTPLRLEGTFDAAGKTLTMKGEGVGPDGKPVKYQNVTKIEDDDHHTFVMSVVGADGAATEMMTIRYQRKK